MNFYTDQTYIKNLIKDFLFIFGAFWLIIESLSFFFPNFDWLSDLPVFLSVLGLSFVFSFLKNLKKKTITFQISGTEAKIIIYFDDILQENGNIVFPSSNFFNTSADLVAPNTLLGQYIDQNLNGNPEIIEEGLKESLKNIESKKIDVKKGKKASYPIGTVGVFKKENGNKGFLIATTNIYEENGEIKSIKADITTIYQSLNNLWDKVSKEIDDGVLDLIPLGTGVSRAFNTTIESIFFIALSFINQARIRRPCKELRIFIKPDVLKTEKYYLLKNALSTLTG